MFAMKIDSIDDGDILDVATVTAHVNLDIQPIERATAELHEAAEFTLQAGVEDSGWPAEESDLNAVEVGLAVPNAPASLDLAAHVQAPANGFVDLPQPIDFWTRVGKKAVSSDRPASRENAVMQITATHDEAPQVSLDGYHLLGQYFVIAGRITEEQLKAALAEQAVSFLRIGEILVNAGLVTESEIAQCVEQQAKYRQLSEILKMMGLKANHVQSVLMRVEKRGEPIQQVMRDTRFLSEEKVALVMASLNGLQHFSDSRTHACDFARVLKSMDELKLSMPQYDGYVPVAILDNGGIAIALDDIEKTNDAHNFFSAYPKKFFLLASSHTLQKITRSNYTRTEEAMHEAIARAESILRAERGATVPGADGAGEKQGFMRELIGYILRHATYSGASDIHFQCSSYCGKLAMRYDGVLRDVAFYDPELHDRISTMLTTDGVLGTPDGDVANTVMREGKVSFGRDTETARKFADIMELFGYRLQVGSAANGTRTAVIRVVDSQGATADLDNLNFDPESRAIIDAAISAPDGLIILVGPTGSGKTTTLYACMGEIDPVENSIQTSEKPVEGVHGQWKQYSPPDRSGSDEGKEMGLILKGMLRNDPDVILVGEIRDGGVANTAIQGAKTGHLVFTTLHVDHAAQTPSRLAGLGVDPQDIASTLKLVIAQRLVRKVCTNCAVPDTRESTMKNLKSALDTYLKSIGNPKILRARDGGCPNCRGTGYRGRTMAYELLRVNRKIRGMIEAGTTTMKLEEAAIGKGKSMWQVGLRYVATGVTSMDELLRSVPHDEVN